MNWQTHLNPVVESIRNERSVPGMIIAVSEQGRSPEYLVAGTDAQKNPLSIDTLFPVASITKLATALAILRLVATGALQLDDPLRVVLPDAHAAQEGVTVRTLLCHISGLAYDLAPGLAPYTPHLNWSMLAQGCLKTPVKIPPQSQVRYSNVGTGLLAIIVERLTQKSFRDALADLVLSPLHIDGFLGEEPPRHPAVLTGDLGQHIGTPLERYNSAFWRSLGLPWGGLLTNAAGVLALLRAFTGEPTDFLPQNLLTEATRAQTGELGGGLYQPFWWERGGWGLGVELRDNKSPHWTPTDCSPLSFGHIGASGCLAWHVPEKNLSWVILGTRTFESWWMAWSEIGALILTHFQS